MPVQPVERKLAAIFAADIAGYSRLMAGDEVGTLARLRACRSIVDGLIASHRGRIFNTAGDSVVADFASAVDAVQCAVAVQTAIATENAGATADEPMQFRIGVHVGDVMVDGENLLGDGVNIAARLEGLAEPGAICVSAVVRDQVGNKLPLGFDDLGDQQVKNIAQAIRVYRVQAEKPAAKPAAALPLPDKPSVTVLPFQNMSGDPEQEYFADGMVEEIITAQLIEAETGAHLWADRFDGSLEGVFDLQDQVATAVAGVIEPALMAAERARSGRRPTRDLTAYDYYLRAAEIVLVSSGGIPEASSLLEKAIARDQNYAPALALAAVCRMRLVQDGLSVDPGADREIGRNFARRALQLADDEPVTLANAALALGQLGEDIDTMIRLARRAVELNPGFARGRYILGHLHNLAGQPEAALEHLEAALRLSPRGRFGLILNNMGIAYFLMHRFEDAIAKLLLEIQAEPEFVAAYRFLAASYAHMGRLDDARKVVAKLREINPAGIAIGNLSSYRNPAHRELYSSGLQMAMGETE